MIRLSAPLLALLLVTAPARAFVPALPEGAEPVSERGDRVESYALPVAPFDGTAVPSRQVEGRVAARSWRLDGAALDPLEVMIPLRDQLVAEGYEVLLDCADGTCGGFDFRFGTRVVPAPDMYVDIRDYRFLSALRGAHEAVSLLVSRSRSAAWIQVISVEPAQAPPRDLAPAPGLEPGLEGAPGSAAAPGTGGTGAGGTGAMIQSLTADGHAVLRDLSFDTGADALSPGDYPSLRRLARYLAENPSRRIALVGHTDSVGALAGNIALSKRRAQSVRERLLAGRDIAPDRVEAEGMGYLAPIQSNLTPEGREANRRVEVILLGD